MSSPPSSLVLSLPSPPFFTLSPPLSLFHQSLLSLLSRSVCKETQIQQQTTLFTLTLFSFVDISAVLVHSIVGIATFGAPGKTTFPSSPLPLLSSPPHRSCPPLVRVCFPQLSTRSFGKKQQEKHEGGIRERWETGSRGLSCSSPILFFASPPFPLLCPSARSNLSGLPALEPTRVGEGNTRQVAPECMHSLEVRSARSRL